MSREAQKYRDYARECLRQAEEADTSERRDKLLELARVWADAAAAIEGNGQAGVTLAASVSNGGGCTAADAELPAKIDYDEALSLTGRSSS